MQVGILLLEQLKPYDKIAAQLIEYLPQKACKIVFLEEEIRAGGFGMLLLDKLTAFPEFSARKRAIVAIDDSFVEQTCNEDIHKTAHVSAEDMEKVILALCKN